MVPAALRTVPRHTGHHWGERLPQARTLQKFVGGGFPFLVPSYARHRRAGELDKKRGGQGPFTPRVFSIGV